MAHEAHADPYHDPPTLQTKRPIEARLRLTDTKGGPLCASVKAEHIEWRR